MKKSVKLSILLCSILTSISHAQIVKTSESTNLIPVNGAGSTYTTVTNPNGTSQTVISIGPRLAIQSPWWINNMINAVTDKGNIKKDTDKENNTNKESEKSEKNIKNIDISDSGEAKPNQPITLMNNEKTEKIPTIVQQKQEKSTGQTNFKSVVIKTNDVAGYNQTSLEEMSRIGQIQTERALRSNIK